MLSQKAEAVDAFEEFLMGLKYQSQLEFTKVFFINLLKIH
jgi:hypothetical protein